MIAPERDVIDEIGKETAALCTPEHIEQRLRETLAVVGGLS